MSYINNMSYANNVNYVHNLSYANNMSYISYIFHLTLLYIEKNKECLVRFYMLYTKNYDLYITYYILLSNIVRNI